MKVCFLFNKPLGKKLSSSQEGVEHDSWLYGLLRIRKFGIESDVLELEKYVPKGISSFLRKYFFTMHYAHLPLFPLFFRYDAVFTSTAYSCLFLKALFRIKRFKWIVLDFNILGTIQDRTTLKQKIFFWALQNGADGIIAISQAESENLKKVFPHLRNSILFLHEATDLGFFKKTNDKEGDFILSVGNYGRDFNTLVDATKNLGYKVVVATKLAVPNSPHVEVVQLNHQEMLKMYSQASIVVISLKTDEKYFDSVGTLALGESFAMGKATIVTHTKSMESYVVDGVNGVFVPQGDSRALSDAISMLMQDHAKREFIGARAQEFAVKNLDGDMFAMNLAKYIKTVV